MLSFYSGNTSTGVDASTYTYDSQNRLLSATKSSATETFAYDGLNRQVSRTVGAASPIYNGYDGWNLIGEYQAGASASSAAYVYGPRGLVKLMGPGGAYYYAGDASGSTSHLSDSAGTLQEWYRYDLHGTPIVYDATNTLRPAGSAYGIRHLFTGQQWYADIGVYDLRNRYYSPDEGRFIQPDPISWFGDPSNLYRYCLNGPTVRRDVWGLEGAVEVESNPELGKKLGDLNTGEDPEQLNLVAFLVMMYLQSQVPTPPSSTAYHYDPNNPMDLDKLRPDEIWAAPTKPTPTPPPQVPTRGPIRRPPGPDPSGPPPPVNGGPGGTLTGPVTNPDDPGEVIVGDPTGGGTDPGQVDPGQVILGPTIEVTTPGGSIIIIQVPPDKAE